MELEWKPLSFIYVTSKFEFALAVRFVKIQPPYLFRKKSKLYFEIMMKKNCVAPFFISIWREMLSHLDNPWEHPEIHL